MPIGNKKIIINNLLFGDLEFYFSKNSFNNSDYIFFSSSRAYKKRGINKGLSVKSVEDLFNKYTKFLNEKYSISDLRNSYQINNQELAEIKKIHNHLEIVSSSDYLNLIFGHN